MLPLHFLVQLSVLGSMIILPKILYFREILDDILIRFCSIILIFYEYDISKSLKMNKTYLVELWTRGVFWQSGFQQFQVQCGLCYLSCLN